MTEKHHKQHDSEHLAKVLGNVLMQSANESVVIAQLEASSYFSPMPASLPLKDGDNLTQKLDKLTEILGGVPKMILVQENKPIKYKYDPYVEAAIMESVTAFRRTRSSVCRTHLYLIGSKMLERHPDLMVSPDKREIDKVVINQTVERFWEHAETSYIRLASFWDRVGQVLDFAFFNVRQYDREGFSSVIDRIYSNYVPMTSEVSASLAWKHLWDFHNSEQSNGLKWLLRRRNLLIHSLHLTPLKKSDPENPLLTYAYNHIETKARERLQPGTPEEEVNILHGQLSLAASLFEYAIDLAIAGAKLNKASGMADTGRDYEE
jgi:hypothetical protein